MPFQIQLKLFLRMSRIMCSCSYIHIKHIPELVSFSIEYIQKSVVATQLKDGSLSDVVWFFNFLFEWNLKD